jgi:hypothetical protein
MMMIVRNTEYDDVLKAVKGRKVTVWTCNTCARMCNGVGGQQAADRLADKLREDGVNVSAPSLSVSAACLMSKVNAKAQSIPGDTDIVISLTCDVGVTCAARAFGKDVLAPLITLGSGFIDADGSLIVTSCHDAELPAPLGVIAERKGKSSAPLV